MAPWPEEDLDTLRRMWVDEKATASQIAAAFGGRYSRSAVLGKLNRLGLVRKAMGVPPRPAIERPTAPVRLPRRGRGPGRPRAVVGAEPRPQAPPPQPRRVAPPEPAPDPTPVLAGPPLIEVPAGARPIWSLGTGDCHWPVSEDPGVRGRHYFCAEPVAGEGATYCAEHLKLSGVTRAAAAAAREAWKTRQRQRPRYSTISGMRYGSPQGAET